jgi:6-phosphogluconolactonase
MSGSVPQEATQAIPGLRGRQIVAVVPEEAAFALAEHVVRHLGQRLQEAQVVHLALSGGSSGRLVCDALAASLRLDARDWARVHVWMVDERCVADQDPRLNFALVRDRLAPRLGLPKAHLHPMPVAAPDGAVRYQRELDAALAQSAGRFDAVVLGMGTDGHTASLFPHSPALAETARSVAMNDGDTVAPPRPRMTLTFPILNRARLLALLVTGASKRPPLGALVAGATEVRSLPIAGVVPGPDAEMVWYLDQSARPSIR